MNDYIRKHETYIKDRIEAGGDLPELYEYTREVISRMQHERLIHLLVTLFTGLLFIGAFTLFMLMTNIVTAVLAVVTGALSLAYTVHYFKLENGVQHLYKTADEIRAKNISAK
jgi:hypothetical protein